MQKTQDSYYKPYASDSEDSNSDGSLSDSESGSDSEQSMYEEPITSPRFQVNLGAINLDSKEKQIALRIQPKLSKGVDYSAFDLSGVKSDVPYTGTSFDMANGTYTSILMINSRDRDTQVYPQPTFFTIKLPRTYRNVSSFQITQMKLLSSFFYFRDDKGNTTMDVLEQGRTITNNGNTVDNIIRVRIREGTYNIDTLLSELQTQLNRTPLFFYYPNGFSDFIVQFTAAGDLSVNFNQPGDNYFNTLTDTFIPNPTIEQIVTTYFATRYAGLSIYSLSQVKIAYYYPVLYEMLLDPQYASQVNLTLTTSAQFLLPGETVRSRIIYTFQGLNDPVILEVIDNNLAILVRPGVSILDNYRTLNTFIYALVNRYTCSYEQNNNRINISSTQLNTSLFNLLNQQAAVSLIDVLNQNGITLQQYSNLLLSNTLYTAVFTNMYNFMQSNFATNFAVDFGTYSPTFYTNVSNSPYVQNGIGAVGVATGYSLALLTSGQEPINSSTQNLQSSPGYWPQITSSPPSDVSGNVIFIGSGMSRRVQDISADVLNVPYNTLGGTVQTDQKLIDNSGNITINPTFGAGDCVTPVFNSQYTVFRFRSYVRQTLQVETLPLPYYYRFPTVNVLNFNAPIPDYFDVSYSYVNSPFLTRTDISNVNINFPQSYTVANAGSSQFNFTVNNPRRFYTFTAPAPRTRDASQNILRDASGYKYPLRIQINSVDPLGLPILCPSVMNIYFYHDQGAFYADISGYRNENPYNYKEFIQTATDLSSVNFTTNVFSGNQYYLIVRSRDLSFQNTRLKVLAYYPNGSNTPIARYQFQQNIDPYAAPTLSFPVTQDVSYNQIYAFEYDRDFIRLPTSSNLMGPDPSSQAFNRFLPVSEVPIGYDISGVSTDLTDYKGYLSNVRGFVPFATVRADPYNHYNFQNLSGYNSNFSNYFYLNSSNAILSPISNNPYTPKRVNYRQYKIVHWYDNQYIPPQKDQPGIPNSNFVALSKVVDASYGSLAGYIYDASGNNGGPQTGIRLDNGVVGFSFLPAEGVWDADEIIFKSAYMERPTFSGNFTDPNKNIKYLGIFPSFQVSGLQTSNIQLSNAVVKLDASGSVAYTPNVQTLYNTFDNTGGTYYRFVKNSGFISALRNRIVGYTPTSTYLFDSNSYYSVIAFDVNSNVIPFYTLMGSYIPYPANTFPVINSNSSNYPLTAPNGKQYYVPKLLSDVNPSYYPVGTVNANYFPSDSNINQSRYEQSMPIKTTFLNTITYTNPLNLSDAFYYYGTDPTYLGSCSPPGYGNLCNILTLAKGPIFFNLDDNRTDLASAWITSNNNSACTSTLRTVSLTNGPDPVDNLFRYLPDPVPPPYAGASQYVGLAANNQGTSDLSGIYVFKYESTIQDASMNWVMSFSIGEVVLSSNSPSWDISVIPRYYGFQFDQYVVNGSNTGLFVLDSNVFCVQNTHFNKFYFTENNVALIQFTTTSNTFSSNYNGQDDTYFATVRFGSTPLSGQVMNFVGMSSLGSNSFVDPYSGSNIQIPFGNNFWTDAENPNPNPFTTLDWTCDPSGNLYILKVPPGPNFYFWIEYIPMINSGSNRGMLDWASNKFFIGEQGTNPSIFSLYGNGVFNYIKVDQDKNIYLMERYPSGFYTPNAEYLFNNWSPGLLGQYAEISFSNYLPNILAGSNGFPVTFQVNRQKFDATALDTQFQEGFPFIASEFQLGISKELGNIPSYFTQICNWQGFLTATYIFTITISPPATLTMNDLGGQYSFDVTLPTSEFRRVDIPANSDQAAIQAIFNTVLAGYSFNIGEINISPNDITYRIFAPRNINMVLSSRFIYNINTFDNYSNVSLVYNPFSSFIDFRFPPIWGTSRIGVDAIADTVSEAWQLMYPTVKMVMRKVQNGFTPITDTTDLTTYPSYSHTAMFYYDNYRDLSNDIFNKFGQESKARFKNFDVSSGYEFKSYIYNIQLNRFIGNSQDVSSNTGYNFLAIRGYSPCENFKCLTRFYLPGRYDFGFISLKDLSNETQTVLVDLSGSPLVNPVYQTVLNGFNNSFKGNFTFGSNSVPGFTGSNYTFTGFGQFIQQYIQVYNTGQSNANLLASITSNVTSNVASYIQTYLSDILPSYVLSRERFTDPLLFSLLFKRGLSLEREKLEYEWGLGWNLGYPKVDTPFDTIQRATSFYKILDDYIYLKLNQEYWMNRLDSSGKENYSITHDPTGQTNQFAAKLLLAPFGSYAQTMIQNPINFNPVLSSIDRLTFQWVDLANVQIDNADCEWNAAVQIVEQVTTATTNSTIPRAEPKVEQKKK